MKHTVKKTLVASVASALVMGGTVAVAAGMDVPIIKATPVLEGLDKPWDMTVRADGTMFFTEKCKGLSMRSPNGQVTNIYGMKGSSGYSSSGADLFCEGQAGMMGVAPDRNFDQNRRLYVASTSDKYHGSGCKSNFERCDGNIVMRLTLSEDLKSVTDRTDIVTDIQYKPFESNQPFGGPGAHNGGRLRVGLVATCGLLVETATGEFVLNLQSCSVARSSAWIPMETRIRIIIRQLVSTSESTRTDTETSRVSISAQVTAKPSRLSMALGTVMKSRRLSMAVTRDGIHKR